MISEVASISAEFIERYQIELEKNPASRVFAPLAEAYRQMGLLDDAFRIASTGVQRHPEFASGRVAFAKILIERKEWEKALPHLEKAAQLSPDNLLAHTLMGETLLELRRPKDALRAFKMVLFLAPNDERALKAVRKWEFLSAEEFDEKLFDMQPVFEPVGERGDTSPLAEPAWRLKQIERAISLADAFTVRGEHAKAMQILRDATERLGVRDDFERRMRLLEKQAPAAQKKRAPAPIVSGDEEQRRRKLEIFLQRIADRRL